MRSIWIRASGLAALLGASGWAQVTQRVSVDTHGVQANGDSFTSPEIEAAISADGRYVAFWSLATNLVPDDTNGVRDVFVRDRVLGVTERVSVSSGGTQADEESFDPSISADGRFVAFTSHATNLVPGNTSGSYDVYVRDRQAGTTVRASADAGGTVGNGASFNASLSADGRFVAFESSASNLVPEDTNGVYDVFVRDLENGTIERTSLDSSGGQGNAHSTRPSITADGSRVAFESLATNLVSEDTNGASDVFLRDRQSGTTARVSLDSSGAECDGASDFPSISSDGRYVTYDSAATDIVTGDVNGLVDVFVRDLQAGVNELVSVSSVEIQGDHASVRPSISSDGRWVAFTSPSTNLVDADTNGVDDVFVRDRQAGTTARASVRSGGGQAAGQSSDAWISADGRYVAFASLAEDLVPSDTNDHWDVFLADRRPDPSFTSLCDPGVDDVLACPCGNPPSGPGRGCDNSSSTGGAILSATGGTYLSSDSLVFTSSAERPTALSLVMQGNESIQGGVVFGQGVRCVGGTVIRRLYIKTASEGAITAPDFSNGDPTVSERSASKGDELKASQSRWYLVFYRDPIVLGGCPSHHTFNATQTVRVTWLP